MREIVIQSLIKLLLTALTPELLKKFVNMTIAFVENHVKGTNSEVDDRIVLPICDMIRKAFDIPVTEPDAEPDVSGNRYFQRREFATASGKISNVG